MHASRLRTSSSGGHDTPPARDLSRAIGKALTCPRCGGKRVPDGTITLGDEGETLYSPDAPDTLSPKVHCVCPDGPVWGRLFLRTRGREAILILLQTALLWRRQGYRSFFIPTEDGGFKPAGRRAWAEWITRSLEAIA